MPVCSIEIIYAFSSFTRTFVLPNRASLHWLSCLYVPKNALHGCIADSPLCLLTQHSEAFSSSFSLIMLEQLDHLASTGLCKLRTRAKDTLAIDVVPLVTTGRRLQ
jgi:hypothetical protein